MLKNKFKNKSKRIQKYNKISKDYKLNLTIFQVKKINFQNNTNNQKQKRMNKSNKEINK